MCLILGARFFHAMGSISECGFRCRHGDHAAPVWRIALFLLKVGAVPYGGGYVLLAFLEQGLVQQHAWLTRQQLLHAIAIGQFTPGSVLSTATFIGYIVG